MRKTITATILFILIMSINSQIKFTPPLTERIEVTDTLHNILITDNYRWLEDGTDPKVIEWTRAQHDYGVQYINSVQKEHPGLRDELTKYLDRDYYGMKSKKGNRVFQFIRRKGYKHFKLFTIIDKKEILIWDPMGIDSTGRTSTEAVYYTYDGEKAAVSVQKDGSEIYTVYIIDTRTGKIINTPLENVSGFSWTKNQRSAYISIKTKKDIEEQNPAKTYYWTFGEPVEKAEFIGMTNDSSKDFFISDTRYSDVTFYGESDFVSNNLYIRETGTLKEGKLIYESNVYTAFVKEAIQNKLYIYSNENAPNGMILTAETTNPDYKNWKVLIPEKNSVIENFEITKHNIITLEKRDLVNILVLHTLKGKEIKALDIPEFGNISGFWYDREEDSLYVNIVSFTSPSKVFNCSPKDFKWRLYYEEPEVVDMSNISGEIKYFKSKDGTEVPAFVISKKNIIFDGKNPVLITGYGGFSDGIGISYCGHWAPFINRGGIVVEAGIRGGNEYGEKWHEAGMLGSKQNTFDDFISCTEWLIEEKYTNPQKIAAQGGSNGGLLVGAVAVQRPDLYKVIICDCPLLDMLRYHKFLLGRTWVTEYGSSDNEPDFRWLLQYSPYHNIRMGIDVPTMLVTSGANDTRVDPMNARKFVAALQNNPGQKNPIILKMDYGTGHGGIGLTLEQAVEEGVFFMEFLMNQLGM